MFLLDIHNHPWVEGTKAWQKKVRPVCRNCVETDLRNRMLGFVKNWDFQIWPKTAETWIGGTKGLASLAVCAVPRPLPIGKRWKTRSPAVCFALISARHCVGTPAFYGQTQHAKGFGPVLQVDQTHKICSMWPNWISNREIQLEYATPSSPARARLSQKIGWPYLGNEERYDTSVIRIPMVSKRPHHAVSD